MILQLDNATAVAYINNMGGIVSSQLTDMAKELWMWALNKGIILTAQHILRVSNTIADTDSPQQVRLDALPSSLLSHHGPLDMDLFASRLIHQISSWRPDPLA